MTRVEPAADLSGHAGYSSEDEFKTGHRLVPMSARDEYGAPCPIAPAPLLQRFTALAHTATGPSEALRASDMPCGDPSRTPCCCGDRACRRSIYPIRAH